MKQKKLIAAVAVVIVVAGGVFAAAMLLMPCAVLAGARPEGPTTSKDKVGNQPAVRLGTVYDDVVCIKDTHKIADAAAYIFEATINETVQQPGGCLLSASIGTIYKGELSGQRREIKYSSIKGADLGEACKHMYDHTYIMFANEEGGYLVTNDCAPMFNPASDLEEVQSLIKR